MVNGQLTKQFITPHSQLTIINSLPHPLCELLRSEASDPVQSEAENYLILSARSDVEGVVLQCQRTAIVGIADRVKRTNERIQLRRPSILEIKEQRSTTIRPLVSVADEDRRTPLSASKRARLGPVRPCVLRKRWDQRNPTRIIQRLKELEHLRVISDRS